MKKLILYLLLTFAFGSCHYNLSFNASTSPPIPSAVSHSFYNSHCPLFLPQLFGHSLSFCFIHKVVPKSTFGDCACASAALHCLSAYGFLHWNPFENSCIKKQLQPSVR